MHHIHYAKKELVLIPTGIQVEGRLTEIKSETFEDFSIMSVFNFFQKEPTEHLLYLSSHSPDEMLTHLGKYFTTIMAAGGLVKNNHKRLLFIYRYGKWDLPKGIIDDSETPEEAASREVTEETDISDLSMTGPLGKTYHVFIIDGSWYLKTTHWFLFETHSKKEPIGQKTEGIEKAIWARQRALPHLLTHSYENIRIVVEAARSKNYL